MEIPRFPNPSDFSSWSGYAEAARTWEKKTREAVGSTRLPLPLASYVHCPVPPLKHAQCGIVKKVVDPRKNPPPPEANLEVLDIAINGTPFDDVTAGNGVPISVYLARNAHWGSELIESEPLPYAYDDFESYAEAMRAWKEKTREREFVHPSDLNKILDAEFEEPGEVAGETAGVCFVDSQNTFDGACFLEMKEQAQPSDEEMERLWEGLQNAPPIGPGVFSNEYPFGGKVTARQLVEMLETSNDGENMSDFAKQLQKFKIWADPDLDKAGPEVSEDLDLGWDLDPHQMEVAVQFLKDPQIWLYDKQQQICFLLSQLHCVKSARFRARMFVLMKTMVKFKPSLTISLFFWSHESMLNVAQLFVDFSNDYRAIQPCRTFTCMAKNVPVRTLYSLLAGHQLLSILMDVPFPEDVQQELKTRMEMHVQEIRSHMRQSAGAFEEFFKHSDSYEEAELQFQLISMLLECDVSLFDCIFNPEHENAIWLWMGRMKIHPQTALFYGNVACHILRRPDLREAFAQRYFVNHTVGPVTQQQVLLSRCSRVLAVLIKCQMNSMIHWENCNSMLLRAMQLIEYDPLHIIELIGALCFYYSRQMSAKVPEYTSRFGVFRISVLNVFYALDFTALQLCALLKGLSPLLDEDEDSSTHFAKGFLPKITSYMGSTDPELVKTSWRVFRKWYEADSSVEVVLLQDEERYGLLVKAVQLASKTEEGHRQINQIMDNPIKRRRTKRKRRDKLDPFTEIIQSSLLPSSASSSQKMFPLGRSRSASRSDPRLWSLPPD